MEAFRKTVSVLLALCVLLGVSACKKKNGGKDNSKDAVGGYSSNTESDYNDTVSGWKSDGEFDNTKQTEAPTPTPGVTASGKSTTNTNTNTNYTQSTVKYENTSAAASSDDGIETLPALSLPESELSNESSLMFRYEGSNYVYGVTNDGNELIAYRDESGRLYDILSGGGKFDLCNSSGLSLLNIGKVVKAEATMRESYDAVVLTYVLSGSAAANAKVQTTYVFKENSISFSSQVTAKASAKFSSERSTLLRGFLHNYKAYDCRVNEQWLYPSNGDYPYPEFESLMFRNDINDRLICYSFMRGEDIPTYWEVEKYNGERLPMSFEDANGLLYTMSYDLCFVDTAAESGQAPNYRALFKSRSSDFAAGVAAITESGDNTTVFVGDEVKLNINVTNLTESDLKFSLRYDIRDYYGKIVDSGIFVNSTAYKYADANRTVTVKGKYGMYYLNLYVISRYSSYIECYPFGLLEKYDYKYTSTSPFGITSANCDDDDLEEWRNAGRMLAKIGVANFRLGATKQQFAMADVLKESGVRFNGGFGPVCDNQDDVEAYLRRLADTVDQLYSYVDSFEVGNEMSLMALKSPDDPRYVESDKLYSQFYQYTYKPSLEMMKKKYPGMTYIPCPFSACEQDWMKSFTSGFDYDADGDGIKELHLPAVWDDIEIVSTHIYGNPYMPDVYSAFKPGFGNAGGLWHIEAGMQRMREFLDQYGDKEFYLTEVGYPTPPKDSRSACLRTQADYIVRTGVIAASYGADRIQFYCVHDRTSYNAGYNSEHGEWNFGIFYQADFYGVVKPKPAGVAYAVMTRQLESMKKDGAVISEKYDEGYDKAGVRAFEFDTALDGKVVVAYSNSEVLTNGKKNSIGTTGDRTPTLPWNNQWTKTDDTVFEAAGNTVTVYDSMGNKTEYKAENGKVTIPLTGSPVYIHGIK